MATNRRGLTVNTEERKKKIGVLNRTFTVSQTYSTNYVFKASKYNSLLHTPLVVQLTRNTHYSLMRAIRGAFDPMNGSRDKEMRGNIPICILNASAEMLDQDNNILTQDFTGIGNNNFFLCKIQ